MMPRYFKTGLVYVLIGLYLFVVAALLTLAIDQARRLFSLYRVSSAADAESLWRLSPSPGNDLLTSIFVAAVLFILVVRRPRRLLPVSIAAALVFVALNLYSGRHVLPQVLVWPWPIPLSEGYVQALAEDDLEAALRLTNRSPKCDTLLAEAFRDDQARLKRSLGDDGDKLDIRETSIKRITTFYDEPFPQDSVILQPVPQQLVTVMVETEKGSLIWLSLRMSYDPFFGTRYLCGQEIG